MSQYDKPLRFYDLLPPEIQNRLLLDYPLDVLLCRRCELMAYEQDLFGDVEKLYDAIGAALCWAEQTDDDRTNRRGTLLKKLEEVLGADASVSSSKSKPFQSSQEDSPASKYEKALYQALYGTWRPGDKTEPRYNTTDFGAIRYKRESGSSIDWSQKRQSAASGSPSNSKRHVSKAGSTGNILIRGRPGTCKSTLALQLAAACTRRPNYYVSLFICLEEQPDQVKAKCKEMHWDLQFHHLVRLTNLDASSSSQEIGQELGKLLCKASEELRRELPKKDTQDTDPDFPLPLVLLPALSPRCLRPNPDGDDQTFQMRYEQLERLLRGFRWLRDNRLEGRFWLPELRLVCIDSLSALAERPLTREEIYRVFDLFTNYGVVGVVTAEEQSGERADTMEYLADVVIDLLAEHDAGYAVRYLEIKKSRHEHQVYGLHPFTVRNFESARGSKDDERGRESKADERARRTFPAIMVYPSIHYNVWALRRDDAKDAKDDVGDFSMGVEELDSVLSHGLKRPGVVTLAGPRGTYKTHISQNFLLDGIRNNESVMLIHLGGSQQFRPDVWRNGCKSCRGAVEMMRRLCRDDSGDSTEAARSPSAWFMSNKVAGDSVIRFASQLWPGEFGAERLKKLAEERLKKLAEERLKAELGEMECQCQPYRWTRFTKAKADEVRVRCWHTHQFDRHVWLARDAVRPAEGSEQGKGKGPVLVELDFGPGALLPERFLKLMRDVFRELDRGVPSIRRVVVDDVSLIGTSYPFLRNSKTSGDLFLSALVHIARYHNCDTLLLGTTGAYGESDEVVKRAATLAGSVLKCDFSDVFGARYITVTGEGLMVGRRRDPSGKERTEYGEFVPAVIEPERRGIFEINRHRLEGLVGFEQGQVHRPGVVVSLFCEGDILQRYNAQVRTLLERAFAASGRGDTGRAAFVPNVPENVVSVLEFDSGNSGPLHESLSVLSGKPIDKTVICALDEFFAFPYKQHEETERLLCNVGDAISRDEFRQVLWVQESEGIQATKSPIFAAPYYSNVLLVAYRKDLIAGDVAVDAKISTWKWLAEQLEGVEGAIDCGSWSGETLACILVDLLFRLMRETPEGASGTSTQEKDVRIEMKKLLAFEKDKLVDELLALRQMFRRSIRFRDWEKLQNLKAKAAMEHQKFRGNELRGRAQSRGAQDLLSSYQEQMSTYHQKLTHNAVAYICWYSQLRELIAEHPDLGPKLSVAALPGGGIRGDWYLGLAQGSVSVKLGENIIKILAGGEEDRRRFAQGVGLPVRNSNCQNAQQKAWNRGNVRLKEIIDIHVCALRRSRIGKYPEVRDALAAICEQTLFSNADGDDTTEIRDLVTQLKSIV